MAGIRISSEAKAHRPFKIMDEGRHVVRITKVTQEPKRNPHIIKIEAENAEGATISNRWDLKSSVQEGIFWLFYSTGCGLSDDEDGFIDPDRMLGCFVDISVVHRVVPPKTITDPATGEEREIGERTYANFGYIHGVGEPFGDASEEDGELDNLFD